MSTASPTRAETCPPWPPNGQLPLPSRTSRSPHEKLILVLRGTPATVRRRTRRLRPRHPSRPGGGRPADRDRGWPRPGTSSSKTVTPPERRCRLAVQASHGGDRRRGRRGDAVSGADEAGSDWKRRDADEGRADDEDSERGTNGYGGQLGRADVLSDMPPVKAARCCQRVCGFRYAGDMRRLVASRRHARVDRRGRALHGGGHPRWAAPGGDRGRHRRRRRHRAGAAEHQRLRHRRPRPRHSRPVRRRDRREASSRPAAACRS